MNSKIARFLPSALVISALLGACSTGRDYPSLTLRDFERPAGTATPAKSESPPPAPPQPVAAELATRLTQLVSSAREADAAFHAQRGTAERAVASAGGKASDSWTTAQVAIAQLQSSRSGAVTALADLDSLYVDARTAAPGTVSPSAEAIGAARDSVSELVARQDAVLARLGSRLRG